MKRFAISVLFAVLPLAAAPAVNKPALTLEGARKVIMAAVAEAQKNRAGGAIAVVDAGGHVLALERLDGTFPYASTVSIGKARTAALFKKPTAFFEDVVNKGRTAMVTIDGFTPLQGGVPLVVDGEVVGAVGVSGANSAAQDTEIAVAAAAAINAAPAPVSYFPSGRVSSAFLKGEVLFDGAGTNFMVHASHRDNPGMVEVHDKDADIVYVLEGKATLVTGGKLVDGKVIAPDEVRGMKVDGGETRSLQKGDVIIIPAGTPHWFQEVSSPFNYYVVKVRP
ncbi:MAG: heme-binding protein [Bryobacteraceae bacterium]|nr:heme-binding protein [Bryobacteraceae bacterium]